MRCRSLSANGCASAAARHDLAARRRLQVVEWTPPGSAASSAATLLRPISANLGACMLRRSGWTTIERVLARIAADNPVIQRLMRMPGIGFPAAAMGTDGPATTGPQQDVADANKLARQGEGAVDPGAQARACRLLHADPQHGLFDGEVPKFLAASRPRASEPDVQVELRGRARHGSSRSMRQERTDDRQPLARQRVALMGHSRAAAAPRARFAAPPLTRAWH